jgi:Fe(3+) dicitrate transport protein
MVLLALACPANQILGGIALAAAKDDADTEGKTLELPAIEVIGSSEELREMEGSGTILERETLYPSHVFTTNEALRKVPGVVIRDEEGFGMRPNIGIRGINPTRSTKTLLLEDGLPLSYAPYGDNASYYHPPIDRFERIEVIKGARQILFGPQTITGTINYITPTPPLAPSGFLSFTGGNRDYYNGHANYGGTWGKLGGLFDFIHKQGDGARDNTRLLIDDTNLKGVYEFDDRNALILRGNYFREDSQVTYSGITDAELRNFGIRYNPFKNDDFSSDRWGTSATHQFTFNEDVKLTTSFYWTNFRRDWWRQASTTTDTQCGAAFQSRRFAGLSVDPDSCNSIQGRLRNYYTWGIEPRLSVAYDLFGIRNEAELGFRAHYEEQFRRQINGKSPKARSGDLVEDNERFVDAYSGFIQNRFIFGDFSFTPGVRVESVAFERRSLALKEGDLTKEGETSLMKAIPGFSLGYSPFEDTTLFVGAHRGFAPPRVEDTLDSSGRIVEVDAEDSWNLEFGFRAKPWRGLQAEATYFRNDFHRQIAVGSIAGGSVPLAVGQSLYQGLEVFGRVDFGAVFDSDHNIYFQTAWTWVADAEQKTPFRCLAVGGSIPATCPNGLVSGSVKGNRQPYAPEHAITAALGYSHPVGFDIQLEAVYVDDQFSDFANSKNPVDQSGLTGKIDDYAILNLSATYRIKSLNTDIYATVKNLLDEEYIVDRTRGILPGSPQLVQAGFKLDF